MQRVVKYIVERTYKPLLVKYLAATRTYTYKNISLEIPPQVFHPGFFFSTKLLLRYISHIPLFEKSFLELGAGSGLISVFAAKEGAIVTATDINTVAIDTLKKNAEINQVGLDIIQSDLFNDISLQIFDIIAINPPYYKMKPTSDADHAWYCGEEGEYFHRLFESLAKYINANSEVLMILCDGCDIDMVKTIAEKSSFRLNCVFKKQNLLEENFIFKIESSK
jgi:release factor glutamine methyltransferase